MKIFFRFLALVCAMSLLSFLVACDSNIASDPEETVTEEGSATEAHVHNFTYEQGDTTHTPKCTTCGYVGSEEAHDLAYAHGSAKTYLACRVCGYIAEEYTETDGSNP